jgi:3',5'-cyclic AMP phosphodiesterase CpdA
MMSRWFCLALLPVFAAAQDFSFLQFSDPQFGMYTENREFAQETANFEFAIATANRLHPAFVIVCGDLTNNHSADQIAEYQRIARRLDQSVPLYNVAGNHDVGNEPTAESLAAYRSHYGPDYYVFRRGDFEGIVLNSSIIQHPEKVPEEAAKQEAWLQRELASAQGRVVIFQHIPWFLSTPDEPDQYFNIPRATRERYLALFEKYGVHEVFAGHYHRNAEGRGPAIRVTTTGPVGKPLGTDPSGIRVVNVTSKGIESQYYGLGNLPNQLAPATK